MDKFMTQEEMEKIGKKVAVYIARRKYGRRFYWMVFKEWMEYYLWRAGEGMRKFFQIGQLLREVVLRFKRVRVGELKQEGRNFYIYAQAKGPIKKGDWVKFSKGGLYIVESMIPKFKTPIVPNDDFVGIAPTSFKKDEYGWILIRGRWKDVGRSSKTYL